VKFAWRVSRHIHGKIAKAWETGSETTMAEGDPDGA
jgi:hypothetical protein